MVDFEHPVPEVVQSMMARGSCRVFQDRAVAAELTNLLCAAAMAAPTKSDLQQRDIIVLQSPKVRAQIASFVPDQTWVANAPMIAIFCGNNRRQRLLHDWKDVPFANDHLDAFFNAVGDAAIGLSAFVTAVEALGLGCCPISAVRNRATEVSDLLNLPQHVFPFAGLAFGYPMAKAVVSKRLPLGVTCHVDQYSEDALKQDVASYDTDRAAAQPYAKQRFPETFGQNTTYAWSDDKVRQYSVAERENFGAYIRAQGFKLD